MKHHSVLFAFVAAAFVLVSAGAAEAQYYGERRDRGWDERPPPGWGPPPGPPRGWGPPPDWRQGPPPGPPGWGGPPPPRQGWRPGPSGPPRGGVCVTSRGACPAGPLRSGSPCRCDIPGFGVKRGQVQ